MRCSFPKELLINRFPGEIRAEHVFRIVLLLSILSRLISKAKCYSAQRQKTVHYVTCSVFSEYTRALYSFISPFSERFHQLFRLFVNEHSDDAHHQCGGNAKLCLLENYTSKKEIKGCINIIKILCLSKGGQYCPLGSLLM